VSEPGTWQEARARLETRKAELDEEIAAYPAPIPACDAQFNHLLELRAGLAAELKRLDVAIARNESAGDLKTYVKSCPFLAGEAGE
jgi:hypothetical protein